MSINNASEVQKPQLIIIEDVSMERLRRRRHWDMQVGANELVRDEVSRAGSYLSLRIAKVLLPRTSSGDALRTLVFWGIKVKDIILVLVIDLITFSCCGRAPLDRAVQWASPKVAMGSSSPTSSQRCPLFFEDRTSRSMTPVKRIGDGAENRRHWILQEG